MELYGETIDTAFSDPQVVKLVQAGCRGDIDTMDRLIAQGANVNASGKKQLSPLAWLLVCRNVPAVERALKAGADPNHWVNDDYPLIWVEAGGDNPATLKLLLKYGGDPNLWAKAQNELMIAIEQSRWENLDILLSHGADINNHDRVGQSAATEATAIAQFDVVELLVNKGYNYDLAGLARLVQNRQVPANSEFERSKKRVLELLSQKGVPIPPPEELKSRRAPSAKSP